MRCFCCAGLITGFPAVPSCLFARLAYYLRQERDGRLALQEMEIQDDLVRHTDLVAVKIQ